MQIITVTYGRTINLGNYQSERIDATAQVGPDETPQEALESLSAWVEKMAGLRHEERDIEARVAALKREEAALQAKVDRLSRLSLVPRQEPVKSPAQDDIPF